MAESEENNMSLKDEAVQLGQNAKRAAGRLGTVSSGVRNQALLLMAQRLEEKQGYLLKENEKDLKSAREAGLTEALVDRLASTTGCPLNDTNEAQGVGALKA